MIDVRAVGRNDSAGMEKRVCSDSERVFPNLFRNREVALA